MMNSNETMCMKASLENCKIADLMVTGILNGKDGKKTGKVDMLLTELCSLRFEDLAKQLGIDPKDVELQIAVEKDGQRIGAIDCDGVFEYQAAPDLRTALGWRIATDGGRVRVIEFFDLDQATAMLRETIRTNNVEKKVFFGSYFKALKRVFVEGQTTRFDAGSYRAATVLWQVATRELGNEHPGYPFLG